MDYLDLLKGRMNNLPKKKSKIVSVFLSSTFSDMHVERDYLIENIYPKLKEYCQNQYGLEFQVVDMRWGIEGTGTKANLASEFCIREVERCKQDSAGPYFITILSHRYGQPNLPISIDVEEFKLLKDEISLSLASDLKFAYKSEELSVEIEDLMEHCYKLDENSQPNVYKLVDLQGIMPGCEGEIEMDQEFKDFNEKANSVVREIHSDPVYDAFFKSTIGSLSDDLFKKLNNQQTLTDFGYSEAEINSTLRATEKGDKNEMNFESYKAVWKSIQKKLIQLFQNAAKSCVEKSSNLSKQLEKYFISITETEIASAILASEKPAGKTLVFMRKIDNIEQGATTDKMMRKFVDTGADSSKKLDELKYVKIPNAYDSSKSGSVFEYTVKWSDEHGISNQTHARYLKKLGDEFYSSVQKLVDLGQTGSNTLQDNISDYERELVDEILNHYYFCHNITFKYENRPEIDRIYSYLQDTKTNEPLIIYGSSGSGKTSLIAKAAFSFIDSLKHYQDNYTVVLRFFGTTASSSSIVPAFKSVVHQLSLLFKLPHHDDYRTYNSIQMSKVLVDLLKLIKKKHPDQTILFFFDSIDQLNKRDYSLEWMFKEFPSNAKFVFSALDEHENIIENMKRNILKNEANYIQIKTLDYETAVVIFEKLLKIPNKTLTVEQREEIFKLFKNVDLYPLYINLVFNIVKDWNSFDKIPSNFSSFNKIEKCIQYIFRRMENDYGKLLVSRCLFYLTSADESGISDVELEDVLSLDDELLNHVFEFHLPPIRKFPITLWNRIKYHLKDYITQRAVDGVNVNCWYHRKFLEVARVIYVDQIDHKLKDQLNLNFLDVFNETWKTMPKPFKVNEAIAKRHGLSIDADLKAVRFTSNQPIRFYAKDTERFNIRKLNKVLGLTRQINDPERRSRIMLEEIFLNFDFITAAFKNYFDVSNYLCSENNFFIDFMICFSKSSYRENDHLIIAATLIQQIMMFNSYWLNKFPDSMPLQICNRILNFYGLSEPFTKFINECDQKLAKDCALVSTFQNQVQSDAFFKVIYDFHKSVVSYEACGYANKSSHILLDYYLCEHSVYKFHWHESEYEKSEIIDEISLPVLNDDYFLLKIFQFSTDKWGICVSTRKQVVCMHEAGAIISTIEVADEIITNLIVIGCKVVLIFYQNLNYFDVYNIATGRCLNRKKFKSAVKFVCSSLLENTAWCIADNAKDFFLAVVLDDACIHVYKCVCDLESAEMHDVGVEFSETFSQTFEEHNIIDCLFENIESAGIVKNRYRLMVSFNDMKILVVSFDNSVIKTFGIQPVEFKNVKDFSILSFTDQIAFLQGDSQVIVCDLYKRKCFTIPGRYKNVEIDFKNRNSGVIYCCAENSLHTYSWHSDEDSYSYLSLMKPFEFYDQVFDMHLKGHPCIILNNGVLIAINGHAGKTAQVQQNLFDKSKSKIDFMEHLFDNYVITYSNESSAINGWNILDGKIVFNLDCEYESIKQVDKCGQSLFVYGAKSQSPSITVFSKLNKSEDKTQMAVCKEMKFDVPFCEIYLTHSNEKNGEFMVLSLIERSKLNLMIMKHDQNKQSWILSTSKTLEVSNYIPEVSVTTANPALNMNFTSLSSHLVLILYSSVIFVNLNNSCIIAEKAFENDPSDLVYQIQVIPNSDDVIVSFNSEKLFYFELKSDNTIKVIRTELPVAYKDMQVRGSLLVILTESIGAIDELIIFSLDAVKSSSSFDSPIFVQKFHRLRNYAITEDSSYLATHETSEALCLYRIRDGKRIARIPPINNLQSMIATREFIILAIDETRVISYLIVDPDEPHHRARFGQLTSRNPKNKIEIDDMDILMNSLSQILTPVANQFIENVTALFIEGVYALASMTNEQLAAENTTKDPYDMKNNVSGDIFKSILRVLPTIRNSAVYQSYAGMEFAKFVRKEIKRGKYMQITIKDLSLPSNKDIVASALPNVEADEKNSRACSIS